MPPQPTGPEAARLPQRKFALLRRLTIPPHALPGSLVLTQRRCGKPSCHCARGDGHPLWSLTFMVNGTKRVEHIPAPWADAVRQHVEEGRAFKNAIAELFAANARLWALGRTQRRR